MGAQHVKEKCVALEVASAVKNVGVHSKNYGKLRIASNKIKTLTDDMARKAQEATHFSEAATELKYKVRGGYITELHYDKTGEYKFTDLLKLREVINQKKKESNSRRNRCNEERRKYKRSFKQWIEELGAARVDFEGKNDASPDDFE